MYCRNCGNIILDTAKFCVHCGQPAHEPTTTSNHNQTGAFEENKKKRIVGLFLGIFAILCIFAIIIISRLDTTENTPHSAVLSDTTATYIEISAEDLFSAYDKNPVSADTAYKNKELKISGIIRDIGKDIFDNVYITLDCGEMIFSIQCYFDDSEVAVVGTLENDQNITIIGTCDGQTGNVVIKHCTIAD